MWKDLNEEEMTQIRRLIAKGCNPDMLDQPDETIRLLKEAIAIVEHPPHILKTWLETDGHPELSKHYTNSELHKRATVPRK